MQKRTIEKIEKMEKELAEYKKQLRKEKREQEKKQIQAKKEKIADLVCQCCDTTIKDIDLDKLERHLNSQKTFFIRSVKGE